MKVDRQVLAGVCALQKAPPGWEISEAWQISKVNSGRSHRAVDDAAVIKKLPLSDPRQS